MIKSKEINHIITKDNSKINKIENQFKMTPYLIIKPNTTIKNYYIKPSFLNVLLNENLSISS